MEEGSIRRYLEDKEINITGFSFRGTVIDYSEERVISHLRLINAVHKTLMGYGISGSINGTIGKSIEKVKVDIKRLNRNLNKIESKNPLDEFLLINGYHIFNQSEGALDRFKEINYLDLIRRSMKKNEICLNRVDESNIRAAEGIEIGTLKYINYNLVEDDILYYLRKVRIKNKRINFDYVIDKYIEMSKLGENSKLYIKILLEIPIDTIRYCRKYLRGRKKIDIEKYLKNIKESYSYEKV